MNIENMKIQMMKRDILRYAQPMQFFNTPAPLTRWQKIKRVFGWKPPQPRLFKMPMADSFVIRRPSRFKKEN